MGSTSHEISTMFCLALFSDHCVFCFWCQIFYIIDDVTQAMGWEWGDGFSCTEHKREYVCFLGEIKFVFEYLYVLSIFTDMASCKTQLEELLLCRICLQEYECPKLLYCGHTACKTCLKSWQAEKGTIDIECPMCRRPTDLQDVDALIDDLRIADFKTLLQSCQRHMCVSCKKTIDSLVYCMQCRVFLCETCKKKHDRKCVGHKAINQANLWRCGKHELPCTLYCEFCKYVVCIGCSFSKCYEHFTREIESRTFASSGDATENMDVVHLRSTPKNRDRLRESGNLCTGDRQRENGNRCTDTNVHESPDTHNPGNTHQTSLPSQRLSLQTDDGMTLSEEHQSPDSEEYQSPEDLSDELSDILLWFWSKYTTSCLIHHRFAYYGLVKTCVIITVQIVMYRRILGTCVWRTNSHFFIAPGLTSQPGTFQTQTQTQTMFIQHKYSNHT